MKLLSKYLILGSIGGLTYYAIEVLWRGYSHISMAILGAICFILIGSINQFYTWDMALISQMFISAIIITVLELFTGVIVNVWLGLNVWDYSDMPYSFLNQICLLYSNLWFLLSLLGIILDDVLRWIFFEEQKPKYKVF